MTLNDLKVHFSITNTKEPIQVTKCALFNNGKFESFIEDVFYFSYWGKIYKYSITNEDYFRKFPVGKNSNSCYTKINYPFVNLGYSNFSIFGLHYKTKRLIIFNEIYIDKFHASSSDGNHYLKFSAKII